MRAALIDAAAHLLAAEGPGALSARRLAAEVGTSTMAIYTHFGGMTALHAAVRREGFSRLTAAFDGAATSVDPVTALAAGCLACLDAAAREPEAAWALFNHRPPEGDDAGAELFRILLRRVEDGVRSGRFPDAEQSRVGAWAGQVWAAMHGSTVISPVRNARPRRGTVHAGGYAVPPRDRLRRRSGACPAIGRCSDMTDLRP